MKRLLPIVISCVLPIFMPAIAVPSDASVVGFETIALKKGNNRIEINFDAVNPLFSTMDTILQFAPANGVIGDELSFVLDCRVQRYCFDSFDGTNYTLKAVKGEFPSLMKLDALPWCSPVWIKHKSDNPVSMVFCGKVDGEYKRLLKPAASHENRPHVTIVLEPNDNFSMPKSIKLEGGHIRHLNGQPLTCNDGVAL